MALSPRLLNLLTVLSLLLCVAACALWVRSRRVGDRLLWVGHPSPAVAEHRLSLLSHDGQFSVNWARAPLNPPQRYASRFAYDVHRPPPPFWWATTGGTVRSFWGRRGLVASGAAAHVPIRFVAVAFASAAALCRFVFGWLSQRRTQRPWPERPHDLRAPPPPPECDTVATTVA